MAANAMGGPPHDSCFHEVQDPDKDVINMAELPDGVLSLIVTRLSAHDIAKTMGVSRALRDAVTVSLWMLVFSASRMCLFWWSTWYLSKTRQQFCSWQAVISNCSVHTHGLRHYSTCERVTSNLFNIRENETCLFCFTFPAAAVLVQEHHHHAPAVRHTYLLHLSESEGKFVFNYRWP